MDTQYRESFAPVSPDVGHPEPPRAATPFAASAAAIAAAVEQRNAGVLFPLSNTAPNADPPLTIRVRRLTMTELAVAKGLPAAMHATVMRAFKEFAGGANFVNFRSYDELAEKVSGNLDLANAMLVLGAIEPRVVLTPEETEGDPEALYVGYVHPDDRIAYLSWCNGVASKELADRLTPFPVAGVGSLRTVPADAERRGEAERQPGHARGGLHAVGAPGL